MVKDVRLKVGHHLTVFHMSENIKVVFGIEPFFHARRMGCVAPVEGRVPYFTKGTIEVSADKKQDVKDGFQIVGDAVGRAMDKQFKCNKRRGPLHDF